MNLSELPIGTLATIEKVGGGGSFRRRLLELGLLPGTRIELCGVAPLGDPMEFLVRGASLSIRRTDAANVKVEPALAPASTASAVARPEEGAGLVDDACARGAP